MKILVCYLISSLASSWVSYPGYQVHYNWRWEMGEERGEAVIRLHFGSVAAFQPNKEQIESYLERLELFMITNKFPEDRRVPAHLSIIGSEAMKFYATY